jgi:hypothetical protein
MHVRDSAGTGRDAFSTRGASLVIDKNSTRILAD